MIVEHRTLLELTRTC